VLKPASLLVGLLLCGTVAADELSGPRRMTLSNESWGTIYYVPNNLHEYKYHRDVNSGVRVMTSALGRVEVDDTGIGGYTIKGPKTSIHVEGSSTSVKVTFEGKVHEFTHDGKNFWVRTPKEPMHYTFTQHDIIVEGEFGKTTITEKNGNYSVNSPKGHYSYVPLGDGGFEVKGGPLARHPGLYRGAIFETAGVGVFIDFKKLDPDSPLFRFLEFSPILEHVVH
jgi:hypothetical protein